MKKHLLQDQTEQHTVTFDESLNIYPNGEDNQYPILVENLIKSSPTCVQCVGMYENFLGGAGFVSELDHYNLSNGFFTYTPNDLLTDIAHSLAMYQGVFIHVNYNALFEKDSFKVLSFNSCRIAKKDDKNYNGKIRYSKTGWGVDLKEENIKDFDVFNPTKEVIQAQVESAGGWDKYKGQILFYSLDKGNIYPTSLIDSSYLFADSEHRIGLFYNSLTKRGFNSNKIILYKTTGDDQQDLKIKENVKELMGTNNAGSVMAVETDFNSDDPNGHIKIVDLAENTKADKYAHFEQGASNYIRKAFKNIPPQLIDFVQGKLGNNSGEDLRIAQSIYNISTANDRTKITRLFKVLFENYKESINTDWRIKQYKIFDDGTTNE